MTEAPQFNYAADDIGDGGHYTQVVWRASIRIGCAIVNCPNLTYHDSVLCDYSRAGTSWAEAVLTPPPAARDGRSRPRPGK